MSRIHDALESCLADLRAGADLEACLGMVPDLAEQLRPALEAALAAMALSVEEPPAAAANRSRSLLLARARSLSPQARQRRPPIHLPRFAMAGLAAVLAVFLGGGGLLVASAAALPGDPLYGLKRTAEDVRLRLASSSARAELERQFNDRRTGEIQALFSLGRVTPVSFEGIVASQADNLWLVGSLPVHLSPETELEGFITLGRTVEVSGLTQAGGEIHALAIWLRGFELTGIVEEIDETDWIIEGVDVVVPGNTPVDPGVVPGARVVAQLRVDDEGDYIARSITLLGPLPPTATPVPTPDGTEEPEDEQEETEFEGQVESITGSVWVVSGVQVMISGQTRIEGDPAIGDAVRVEGVLQPGGGVLADRIRRLGEDETPEPEPTEVASPSTTESPDQEDQEEGERVDFEGDVESISAGLWVVDGQAVIVTGQTEIQGGPEVGERVRVRAIRAADGNLVAERIEAHD